MCIIAVKAKGVPTPTEEIFKNCFNNNRDGAGFMYSRGGVVHIAKGFMTFKAFMDGVNNAQLTREDSAVFHFRISTAGGVSPELTHPYPLVADYAQMKALSITCSVALAHNGCLSIKPDAGVNDTMTFIRRTMFSHNGKRLDWAASSPRKTMFNMAIMGSRIVILHGEGTFDLLGTGWESRDGVWYSNKGYLCQVYAMSTWEDWDDERWGRALAKSVRWKVKDKEMMCPVCSCTTWGKTADYYPKCADCGGVFSNRLGHWSCPNCGKWMALHGGKLPSGTTKCDGCNSSVDDLQLYLIRNGLDQEGAPTDESAGAPMAYGGDVPAGEVK